MTCKNESNLVSIVLPVYNGEKYLGRAIESIINQEYSNWELIIVNDCSNDSSLDIMKKYSLLDDRIRMVNNDKNLGLPKSLNVGFREARGAYYTWTSDDNFLHQHMLKRLVEELENDDYGMVYSDFICIDEDGNELYQRRLDEPEALGDVGSVIGASFLYKSEICEQIGEYDPDLFLAEDYDYWLRIYAKTKIKHISDILYYYRLHSASLTATKEKAIKAQTLRAIHKNFWILLGKADSRQKRKRLFDMMIRYGDDSEKRVLSTLSTELFMWKKTYWIDKRIKRLLRFVSLR